MTESCVYNYIGALARLREGNREYCGSERNSSLLTEADRRYHVENGQHPFACVVCCSDSRVVPEHIFSVGIGALFTVRTAGNVIGAHELASVEYAALHLHTPLVVVMGHTHCGAVAAALEGGSHGAIAEITDKIRGAVVGCGDIRACERRNAEQGVIELMKSPSLKESVRAGKLKIIAAMYDTESGCVSFQSDIK